MGLKALITFDLPNATEDQRNIFYECLETNTWTKFGNLSAAWEATFNNTVDRNAALDILNNDLQKAKQESKLVEVHYAIQLGLDDIIES